MKIKITDQILSNVVKGNPTRGTWMQSFRTDIESALETVFASMSPEQLREFASGLITEANEREGYKDKKSSRIGTNSGHGHVWERPDGVKARCGGPGLCPQCSSDKFDMEAGL